MSYSGTAARRPLVVLARGVVAGRHGRRVHVDDFAVPCALELESHVLV